jgi:hypothetical protein
VGVDVVRDQLLRRSSQIVPWAMALHAQGGDEGKSK